jgi:activator of HSP90 ATPase
MNLTRHTRRDFPARFAALLPLLGIAKGAFSLTVPQADRNGISHTSESIHQEVVFKAARKRVYEALTDEKKFSQVTDFIMKGASTEISREVGATFSIFGGVIVGRHIELVPDERIVQAWREKDWAPGVYSIVRFQLDGFPQNDQGSETKLIFDHTCFPEGAAVHLAPGWWSHYWEPLQKFLGEAPETAWNIVSLGHPRGRSPAMP